MTSTRSTIRGEAIVAVIALIALAGWLGPKVLPKVFDKGTRQAAESAAASAEVEARIAAAVDAEQAKGAVAAASVQQIGVAAGQLPDSPQRTFIVRESGWVAPILPPPDPAALLAAERRRVAILEGQLELADRLYREGARDNAALLARATKAEARLGASLADRRAVDTELAETAAYARGKDAIIGLLCAIAALAGCGWLYSRITGFGRADIARMANRIREGMDPLQAIDATVPDWQHEKIEKTAAALRAKEAAKLAARQAAAAK